MVNTLKPRNVKDVEAAVRWALGEDKALEIVGRGSKRALGRPSQTDLTLDLSGLKGVMLYEPAELVLSARAGTPLAEIEDTLSKGGQMLACEPPYFGPQATLGGCVPGSSGPRPSRQPASARPLGTFR